MGKEGGECKSGSERIGDRWNKRYCESELESVG